MCSSEPGHQQQQLGELGQSMTAGYPQILTTIEPAFVISPPLTLQPALTLGDIIPDPGVTEEADKCLVGLTSVQRPVHPQTSWCHPVETR